jgi:hypothetical protein
LPDRLQLALWPLPADLSAKFIQHIGKTPLRAGFCFTDEAGETVLKKRGREFPPSSTSS